MQSFIRIRFQLQCISHTRDLTYPFLASWLDISKRANCSSVSEMLTSGIKHDVLLLNATLSLFKTCIVFVRRSTSACKTYFGAELERCYYIHHGQLYQFMNSIQFDIHMYRNTDERSYGLGQSLHLSSFIAVVLNLFFTTHLLVNRPLFQALLTVDKLQK